MIHIQHFLHAKCNSGKLLWNVIKFSQIDKDIQQCCKFVNFNNPRAFIGVVLCSLL